MAALGADEAGRPGAVGRMDAFLVVDHRHAGLQRVVLDRLHQAGPAALGRLYLAPVCHLGGAPGLAVDRPGAGVVVRLAALRRSEEHTSELQSLMRISYAVFCLKKKKKLTVIT